MKKVPVPAIDNQISQEEETKRINNANQQVEERFEQTNSTLQ